MVCETGTNDDNNQWGNGKPNSIWKAADKMAHISIGDE